MTLPAVVTILDLATAAAASTGMWLEASFTTGSVATTNRVSLAQIMSTNLGALPTGGATGQLLTKSSGSDFATAWSNISSLVTVNATSSLQLSGSTAIALALASVAGLSVLGTNTSATTIPLPITAATGAQVLRANDAGTGVAFGAVNLASAAAVTGVLPGANMSAVNLATSGAGGVQGILPGANMTAVNLATAGAGGVQGVLPVSNGGSGTSTLTAFGVLYGNATSTVGITAAGTTAWPLVGQGTAAAPAYTTLGVLGGGVSFTSYTVGDLLVATTATALFRLNAATAGYVLMSRGAATSPTWQVATALMTSALVSASFSTTSGTFVSIPGGTVTFVLNATSNVMFLANGPVTLSNQNQAVFGLRIDGATTQTLAISQLGTNILCTIPLLYNGGSMAPGTHTVTWLARTSDGVATLSMGFATVANGVLQVVAVPI